MLKSEFITVQRKCVDVDKKKKNEQNALSNDYKIKVMLR